MVVEMIKKYGNDKLENNKGFRAAPTLRGKRKAGLLGL